MHDVVTEINVHSTLKKVVPNYVTQPNWRVGFPRPRRVQLMFVVNAATKRLDRLHRLLLLLRSMKPDSKQGHWTANDDEQNKQRPKAELKVKDSSHWGYDDHKPYKVLRCGSIRGTFASQLWKAIDG
jgi:hypothetical protein